MKLIRIEEARAGLTAARDVKDLRGNLLFRSGTPLVEVFIAQCRESNVSHLFVEDPTEAQTAPAHLMLRKQAVIHDVTLMFSGVDSTPTMVALREAAKRYLCDRME